MKKKQKLKEIKRLKELLKIRRADYDIFGETLHDIKMDRKIRGKILNLEK